MPRDFYTSTNEKGGYEQLSGTVKRGGSWINTPKVRHHRLCAVAWFGWNVVEGNDVHHRVNIPWLNTESNLLPIPGAEHGVLSTDLGKNGPRESVREDVVSAFGGGRNE